MKRLLAISTILFLGAGCAPATAVPTPPPVSAPAPTPVPPPEGIELTPVADYGVPFTLSNADARVFSDGLQVTLTGIDDSRCKKGNTCIWAGELAYMFKIENVDKGGTAQTLNLSTVRQKETSALGRTFTLVSGDENSATISVK